jgi:hypothetical protein
MGSTSGGLRMAAPNRFRGGHRWSLNATRVGGGRHSLGWRRDVAFGLLSRIFSFPKGVVPGRQKNLGREALTPRMARDGPRLYPAPSFHDSGSDCDSGYWGGVDHRLAAAEGRWL